MLPFGLIKMLMSDSFENKVIQFSIGFIVIVILCFAWWTTNITEQPHYRTVVLLDRRFRRRSRNRLTTHIQSTQIVEDTGTTEVNTTTENNQSEEESVQNSNKPPEASTSTNNDNINETQNQTENEEISSIFQIMDADASEVRLRRLAYYEHQEEEITNEVTPSSSSKKNIEVEKEADNVELPPVDVSDDSSSIRIKLKYLNDELKLVDGRLEEQLGDFKRRHFQLEFSSNKVVRLIFNGQVLQADADTLQSCGLFDNCVVHCLVHQQRNPPIVTNDDNTTFTNNRSSSNAGVSQNQQQGREWDLGNIFFVLVSIILGSAWYFRYEYGHLYTVTATVALVGITGIFTICLIGLYFPDNEPRVDIHTIRT